MKQINENTVVDMQDVLGNLAIDYNIPYLTFPQLVSLGMRTVQARDICNKGKKIAFDELCEHIKAFVNTPFGMRVVRDILAGKVK